MRPTYERVINNKYRAKERYPQLVMREVTPIRVYYDYPKRLPWEPEPDPYMLKRKYVEFVFTHEDREITERYEWYVFFRYFERVDG